MTEAVAIIVGSTISACVAVLAIAIQHRLNRNAERRIATAERLASFGAAAHALALGVGDLARADLSTKAAVETRLRAKHGDHFNTMLSTILLLDDQAVVASAFAVDQELVKLTRSAVGAVWSREDWRAERQRLSDRVDEFQSAARKVLHSPPLPVGAPRQLPLPGATRTR